MENVHRCCCGLDVDKKNVAANLPRRSPVGTEESDEVRRFATTTGQLLEIADDRLVHGFHELPSDPVPPRLCQDEEIAHLGTSKARAVLGQVLGVHRPPHEYVTDRNLVIPRCQIGDEAGSLPLQASSMSVDRRPWRFRECTGECRQI